MIVSRIVVRIDVLATGGLSFVLGCLIGFGINRRLTLDAIQGSKMLDWARPFSELRNWWSSVKRIALGFSSSTGGPSSISTHEIILQYLGTDTWLPLHKALFDPCGDSWSSRPVSQLELWEELNRRSVYDRRDLESANGRYHIEVWLLVVLVWD